MSIYDTVPVLYLYPCNPIHAVFTPAIQVDSKEKKSCGARPHHPIRAPSLRFLLCLHPAFLPADDTVWCPSIHRIRSHHTTSQNPRDQTLPPVRWSIVHPTKLSVQFRIRGLAPKTGYFTINGDKTFASQVVEATCSGRLDPVPAAGNLNGI